MTHHATNVATITVLDILQSYGVSGIKSRQIAAKIEAEGYVIVPATELDRWVTCVNCEAHKPERLMWREIARSGWLCQVCAEEYR